MSEYKCQECKRVKEYNKKMSVVVCPACLFSMEVINEDNRK